MGKNRTVWVIIGLLIVVFVIVGVVAGGGKKSKSKGATIAPVSARAVVLPANQTRTVVVPPCNTPVSATARNAARGRPTPGATTVELPRASGVHTLLVPHCQPSKSGSTNADGSIPSAAFVLGDTKPPTKDGEGRIAADGVIAAAALILPDGSDTSTIVVPPCTKKAAGKERDSVLSADKDNSDLVVGPSC